MIFLSISHSSTLQTRISLGRRTTSKRTSRMRSSVVVMLTLVTRLKLQARRNWKSLVVWLPNLSSEGPMIFFPNIVWTNRWLALSGSSSLFAVPVKYEQVVFCHLSEFQLALYRLFISSPEIQALLRGVDSQPLKAINILKKLCNHPELLDLPNDLRGSDHLIPQGFNGAGASVRDRGRSQDVHCQWSGKFIVLERYLCSAILLEVFWLCAGRFLQRMRAETNDKIVLISNYTQTLDLFEKLLRSKKWASSKSFKSDLLTTCMR